jgi:hypothetical protein
MHPLNNYLYKIRPEKFSIARKSVDKKCVSPPFHLGQKARTTLKVMFVQGRPRAGGLSRVLSYRKTVSLSHVIPYVNFLTGF